MSFVLTPLVYQLGIGGIGGVLAGYAVKKISKLILVLIGLLVFFLFYLGTQGIIRINYEELWNALAGLLGSAGQTATWLIGLISLFPALGSFGAGLLIGFKLG